jgi:hypothetical protein
MKIFSNFRDANDENDSLFKHLKKYNNKPISFWYDKFPTSVEELNLNPYNFLFIHEPNEFFGLHSLALSLHSHFTLILTWNESLISNCDNGVLFTYNGATLDDQYSDQFKNKLKQFNVSFLCGDKNLVEGHKLRQEVYKLENNITIPKKWFYVLEDYDHNTKTRPGYSYYTKDLSHIPKGVDIIGYGRRILFNDSMFNIVIENVNHNNWYNKIGDNFLTKTIPIYWGCPNIEEFGYDERGIIRFENDKDLIKILNSLDSSVYEKMKPYIDHNYEVAKLDSLENKITDLFNNFLEINNI